MDSFEKVLLNPEASILEALKKITEGSAQIVLVVDENRKLLGTVTDGDIRRGILQNYALADPVKNVMNLQPIKIIDDAHNSEELISIMTKHHIRQLPLIDKIGRVCGLQTLDELLHPADKPNLAIIMSGGLGKRLRPLTDDIPKPMLRMGGKPLLEVNIERLRAEGFRRFCITVGYKAEIIREYFGDGSKWNVSIDYIHEEKPLGTAGALRFLEAKEKSPMIVMNGDLLTTVKFSNLLDFHHRNGADCTICIRELNFQFPYGVVHLANHQVTGIVEKPVYRHYVNAGVYVFEPTLVSKIPVDSYYPMNHFIELIIKEGNKVEAFPLMEYWSDIGQMADYEKACQEFEINML